MSRVTQAFLATTLAALLGAATLHVLALAGQTWVWGALVHLGLYGWITGMILTVNYHMLPVFSGRNYPAPWLLAAHWLAFTVGLAGVTGGLLAARPPWIVVGLMLEVLASLLFIATTILLFRCGPRRRQPPPPTFAHQRAIDRVATQATRRAGLCLPLSLGILLAAQSGWVASTWVLAAEHLATLGWMMLMIVGVAQHVLPRYSGRAVRGPAWARTQLELHTLALALMVPALGLGWSLLLALGAVVMSGALALFAWTIWPALPEAAAGIRFWRPVHE